MLLSWWRKPAHPTIGVVTMDYNTRNFNIIPCILASLFKAEVKGNYYSDNRNQKKEERKSCHPFESGPLNSKRETREAPATFPQLPVDLFRSSSPRPFTGAPGIKCVEYSLPVQRYGFCRLCLRISLTTAEIWQKVLQWSVKSKMKTVKKPLSCLKV